MATVTRSEFVEHLANLYDGKTTLPCTLYWNEPETGIFTRNVYSQESFESWRTTLKTTDKGITVIDHHRSDLIGFTFADRKERDLQSLNEWLDRTQYQVRFHVGFFQEAKMNWLEGPHVR